MEAVQLDRSVPGVLDLALRGSGGSLGHAVPASLGSVMAVPALFMPGALLSTPLVVVLPFAGTGWGPVRTAAGIVGAVASPAGWAPAVHAVVRGVDRLRFATVPGPPTTVTPVRGARAGRPKPAAELRQIRIDHCVEEPYDGDPRGSTSTVTLTVLLRHGRIPPKSLPPSTDAAALHRQLREALAPAVAVDLHARRYERPRPPPPPSLYRHTSAYRGAIGHGGSTGGGS